MGIFNKIFGSRRKARKKELIESKQIAIAGACCEICKRVFIGRVDRGECKNCYSRLPKPPRSNILARFCINCARFMTCPQCGARLIDSVIPFHKESIESIINEIYPNELVNK